ncbi:MAG: thiamine-phosphate kinase [Leptospiraceae bacterium]|nr:thiamine-phosphate kinase [Leptospiraceae bacterium]
MQESKIIQYLHNKKSQLLDDCYFFDNKYLITTDTITENTHFKHRWSSARDIAEKLVEVNVSDIAASGGLPKLAFLNLGLSKLSEKEIWLESFLKYFKKKLNFYGIELAGGDTYKSHATNLTITLFGTTKNPVFRNTGKPAEFIYITGSLGLSYLGYSQLKDNINLPIKLKRESINKHLRPKSRLEISQLLIQNYKISAMMDITDGLVQDSEKLALASNLEMEIEINRLPRLSQYTKYITIDELINSGEELELLFISKEKIESMKNCQITCIGKTKKIYKKSKVVFNLGEKVYKPKSKGFLHFK